MSLLINGMDMPKCCYDCFALDDNGDYDMCGITIRSQGYRFDSRNNKMKDCPLTPLPQKHGSLIDADAYQYSGDLIDEPTIIEAEQGDG